MNELVHMSNPKTLTNPPFSPELQSVLARVTERITPTARERGRMESLSQMFLERTQRAIDRTGLGGVVSLQGSMAKDTWLHGQADIDIFVQFPPSLDRSEWTGKVLPVLRQEFRQYLIIERYAEHPYLEFRADSGVRVNVVPCYNVERGKWLSATDRTPFHKEYMNSHLTNDSRALARLVKRYCMGIGVYGADIKTGGFSGMLVETLSLSYGSFPDLLRNASGWKEGTLVDLENVYQGRGLMVRKKFEDSPLIVIDPIDPDRNLAASLRTENLWNFVASARALLDNPTPQFFFPATARRSTIPELRRKLAGRGTDTVALSFRHEKMVPDILWGQLYRLERTFAELMDRYDFEVIRSRVWSDERTRSILLYQIERSVLSETRVRQGPPVERISESESFLDRHLSSRDTVRGPWLEGERWMVEKKRQIASVDQLFKYVLKQGTPDVSLPNQLEKGLRRGAKLVINEAILKLGQQSGFVESFSEFLEAKPRWMRRDLYRK